MTYGQYVSMVHWGNEQHQRYLCDVRHEAKRRSVAMPYAGWAALADILRQEAFTKWGKGRPSKLTDDAKGTRSALHCIEKHLMLLASHPALDNMAVLGSSGEMMSVWRRNPVRRDDQPGWSLMPVGYQPMMVLYPVVDEGESWGYEGVMVHARVGAITRWKPVDWSDAFYKFDLFPDEEHRGWVTPP